MATDEETPLLVENTPSTPTLNHKRDVHILCWAFLLIFLAYGAAQNLESAINTEGDLGTISLGILYLSFTFFSALASLVVRKLGSKNALVLGTTGYWLFIAANLKPTWYTMVPASVYLGFAASIIWVAQEGAFAQLKFWQSASIALVFFISSSISLQTMAVLTGASAALRRHMDVDSDFDGGSRIVLAGVGRHVIEQGIRGYHWIFRGRIFFFTAQLFRRYKMDIMVPPVFAAVIVTSASYAVIALGLWEVDEVQCL